MMVNEQDESQNRLAISLPEKILGQLLLNPDIDNARRGTLKATPKAHTHDTTDLVGAVEGFLTASVALDFPNVGIKTSAELTVTVTGATVGDDAIATPPASPGADMIWCAYVSAVDTVTVRLYNGSAGAIDPASQTWRVTVIKH